MSEAPLYAGPLQGIRAWRVVSSPRDGAPTLAAAAQSVAWTPGEPMRGVCVGSRRAPARRPHFPPEPGCSCGIYAHHPLARAGHAWIENVLAADPRRIAGVISAWGNLEVHLDGFRAELARPDALFFRSDAARKVVGELADRYGVPAIEIPDARALRAYCRTLNGISPKQASAHVSQSLEISLAPAVSAFVDEGEAVAQSGYRLDQEACDLDDAALFRIPGFALFPVVGVSFRAEDLQHPGFSPGQTVTLVPEPDNPHDPNAIGVWDEAGEVQAGYVPKRYARRIRAPLKRGVVKRAYIVSQFRRMSSGERTGIKVLTSPTEAVTLVTAQGADGVIVDDGDIPF